MAMSSKILCAILPIFVVAGCNTTKNIGQEDPAVGESVKYNAAVQTVNPDPVYPAGAAQPGDSGVKGAAAVKRYRSDAVKQVEVMQTTSGTSGGTPR
jgi:predicted small secreted protein